MVKAGDAVSVDPSKGIQLTLSPSWSKNPRALQLVADIEAQRRKCPAVNLPSDFDVAAELR